MNFPAELPPKTIPNLHIQSLPLIPFTFHEQQDSQHYKEPSCIKTQGINTEFQPCTKLLLPAGPAHRDWARNSGSIPLPTSPRITGFVEHKIQRTEAQWRMKIVQFSWCKPISRGNKQLQMIQIWLLQHKVLFILTLFLTKATFLRDSTHNQTSLLRLNTEMKQ